MDPGRPRARQQWLQLCAVLIAVGLFAIWARYSDYREVDVILAVRPGTRYDIDLKPATKLYNAWMAGCPALLSTESAYREVRRSEYDYEEVDTADEAIEAVRRLAAEFYGRVMRYGTTGFVKSRLAGSRELD